MRAALLILVVVVIAGCESAPEGTIDGGAREGGVPIDASVPPGVDARVEPGTDAQVETVDGGAPVTGCSAVALELIDLVNDYRAENGLPAIPASPSLCIVSSAHTHDLADHAPHTAPGGCNLHSWSAEGAWTPCCYTPDHAEAACMWDKPRELTDYPGNGYENAFSGSNDPRAALAGWQGSTGHREVILNQGIWASHPWRALGADVHGGFAVLWFGEQEDPAR